MLAEGFQTVNPDRAGAILLFWSACCIGGAVIGAHQVISGLLDGIPRQIAYGALLFFVSGTLALLFGYQ